MEVISIVQFIMKKNKFKKIVSIVFNKYLLTTIALGVWLAFFDRNDAFTQYDLYCKVQQLKGERDYYQQDIENSRKMIQELQTNTEVLEKYAREVHLMKKPDEDVFVIKSKESKI
jgi:cell division protein DivIC